MEEEAEGRMEDEGEDEDEEWKVVVMEEEDFDCERRAECKGRRVARGQRGQPGTAP